MIEYCKLPGILVKAFRAFYVNSSNSDVAALSTDITEQCTNMQQIDTLVAIIKTAQFMFRDNNHNIQLLKTQHAYDYAAKIHAISPIRFDIQLKHPN